MDSEYYKLTKICVPVGRRFKGPKVCSVESVECKKSVGEGLVDLHPSMKPLDFGVTG